MSILKRPKTAFDRTDRESTLMSKLLDKNSGYFEHIMDKCVCSKCTCGKCKCSEKQLKEQNGMPIETNYQREYTEKTGSISNLHHLPEYKDQYKMKFETTNRSDYREFKVRPQTAFRDQKQHFLQPFHAGSTYQLTYTKMPESEKVNIIPQNHPTVMTDLQFLGDTEYKRRFTGLRDKKEPFVNFGAHSSFTYEEIYYSNPINTPIAFYGQSTSQRAFRPYKTKKVGQRVQNQDVQNIPSFYSQYDSTMKREFSTPSLTICPARLNNKNSQI